MYKHFLAQVAVRHRSDDGAYFSQHLLVCGIDLRILLDLPLQLLYVRRVAESVQCCFGGVLLVRKLRRDAINKVALASNLLRLLVDMLAQERELLLGKLSRVRFALILSKKVVNPAR